MILKGWTESIRDSIKKKGDRQEGADKGISKSKSMIKTAAVNLQKGR